MPDEASARVCFTVSEAHTLGGVPQFLNRYGPALRSLGVEVEVIAGAPPPGADCLVDGARTVAGLGRRLSLAGALGLWQAMRATPAEAVFVSNSTTAALLTSLGARLLGRRSLYLAHGLASRFRTGPAFVAVRAAELTAAALSHGVLTLNRDDARTLGVVARIHAFANGIEAPAVRPPRERGGRELRLLCVARHEPQKNIEAMLRALSGCEAPWRLTIVGDGRLLDAHRALVGTLGLGARVTLAGRVAPEAIDWPAHDAFLLCSRSEGMPLSLLEAFAQGLPAIVTDAPGLGEFVETGETGVVLPSLAAPELDRAIAAVGADLARLSANAFAAAEGRFSLSASVARLADIVRAQARLARGAASR